MEEVKIPEVTKHDSYQTAIDVTEENPDTAPAPPVPERQQSYRVRDRHRNDNDNTIGFLRYKLLFLVMELCVVIKTWNAPGCNNLPIIHLIIFLLALVPIRQVLRWNLCVFFAIVILWPAVFFWAQAEWASNHATCNEMLSTWTLAELIVFLYIPIIILFIAISSMLIDSCQEALQIPRAIAALKTYMAPDKKRPENECCICQGEYQNEEKLTQLACTHEFHTDCIDPWLRKHPQNSCPICRASLLPE